MINVVYVISWENMLAAHQLLQFESNVVLFSGPESALTSTLLLLRESSAISLESWPSHRSMRSSRRRFRGVNRMKAVEEVVEPPAGQAVVGHKVTKAHPIDLRRACRTEHGAGGGRGGGTYEL